MRTVVYSRCHTSMTIRHADERDPHPAGPLGLGPAPGAPAHVWRPHPPRTRTLARPLVTRPGLVGGPRGHRPRPRPAHDRGPARRLLPPLPPEIGRASCRERV